MYEDDEDPPEAISIVGTTGQNPAKPEEESADRQESGEVSVGVTVITGYLGAGKSTLINFILNAQHGKKIAVILNEFGEEIGVERAMINEGDGGALIEEWVELANGCVCCTVKHSLVQALEQLVQRKDRLDHILLETTGLANPAPLTSVLWLDDQLESVVRLDSIITVVDAKNLRLQLSEHRELGSFPEAYLQIAFADVVILNKVDLISIEDSGELEKEIHSINSLANIIRSVRCQVDLNKILDCKAYDASVGHPTLSIKTKQSWCIKNTSFSGDGCYSSMGSYHCTVGKPLPRDFQRYPFSGKPLWPSPVNGVFLYAQHVAHLEALLKEGEPKSTRNSHDCKVRTLCICEQQQVSLNLARSWLEEILWEKKYNMDVYRCKGILNVDGSDQLHIIQAVRELYEIVPAGRWKEENRTNKIVFIGKAQNFDPHKSEFR